MHAFTHIRREASRILLLPPQNRMAVTTSAKLIEGLTNQPRGIRHFSKWSEKEKKGAIQRCGLASSKFSNAEERNKILKHLSQTELPVEHLAVLCMIKDLGLPPSGASSRQQFSFYLLSFLCEDLPFPPWTPEPLVKIVVPERKRILFLGTTVVQRRMFDSSEVPHAYLKQLALWSTRREAWDAIMAEWDSAESPFGNFMVAVCSKYVDVLNKVLAFNPRSTCEDLRVEMDHAQWTVVGVVLGRCMMCVMSITINNNSCR